MAKIKVHNLAAEIGLSNRDIIDYLNERGYDAVTAVSAVPDSEVANIRARFGAAPAAEPEKKPVEAEASKKQAEPVSREPAAREGAQKKKSGIVRVFRSQNASRQLQRRPKTQQAPARERTAPARPAKAVETVPPLVDAPSEEVVKVPEAGLAGTEVPVDVKKAETVPAVQQETAVKEPAVKAEKVPETPVKTENTPELKEKTPEKTAEKVTEEAKPLESAASAAVSSEDRKEDKKEETPVPEKEVKEKEPVQKEKTAQETPKEVQAAKEEKTPEAPAAGTTAKSGVVPAGDSGFRNGRVLRNIAKEQAEARQAERREGTRRPQGTAGDRRGAAQGQAGRERTFSGPRSGQGRPAGQNGPRGSYQGQGGQGGPRERTGGPARGSMTGSRAASGQGRTFGQGRPAPGAGFAQGRGGRNAAPQAGGRVSAGDGALAHKTTRERKDGKERERSREERREQGFRGSEQNMRNNQNKTFNRVPKALRQKTNAGPQPEKKEEAVTEIRVPERITVRELAERMKIAPAVLVKELFMKGQMVTVNHEIPYDKAEEIAMDHDIICEKEEKEDVIGELLAEDEEDASKMMTRPPVVCVMGHVDHGKTSLLDAIRNTHVTDREAGGITQHIGAYMVSVNGQKITFLDTPGHEAFTAMRMRGANATDIAVLVVAADDGVMPQTIEAINHAKAADTEIIVAVNKIDKPGANIDRVKQELSELGLIAEDWGGSTVFCPVSAKTQEGIDNLLEMIILTSEMHELKANPDRKARGIVLEAKLDKGRGPVASILIQKGTLRQGDFIACGAAYGKVRAMTDEKGRRLSKATPSMPVEIIGLSAVPEAGEVLVSLDSDREAKDFAAVFVSENKKTLLEETKTQMTLDDLYNQIKEGKLKELPIVVKADVQGSVEAVSQSLLKLSNDEVVVKVIHGGVGAINESDVSLAAASNAIIIGFNVRPDTTARNMADTQNVDIHLYNVIYEAIEDVERALNGMRAAVYEEKVQGHAEIRQVFRASSVGNIAGGYIRDGIFTRSSKVRVFRGDEKIYEGELASLKRFKDDVKEVREGFECGFVFKDWGDFQVEDTVEAYIMVEVPRT